MHHNHDLRVMASDLQIKKATYTDAIAAAYPVGSKVLVRTKHGWERCEVTWTPVKSGGANPHIYVKRLRTGGEHKIDLSGVDGADMICKDF